MIKIIDVAVYRFALPLVKPLALMGREMADRRGLLIRFRGNAGFEGWGEIAPFPGLHRESPREAESQICSLANEFFGKLLPGGLEKLDGGFDNLLIKFGLFPSTRFGVEMAMLNLIAAARRIYLSQLLTSCPTAQLFVNALLSGTKAEMLRQLMDISPQNYRSVKIKVGRLPFVDEIEVIRAARDMLPKNVTLRLDANRAWALQMAIRFASAIGNDRIEYIEEPLKDPAELPDFFQANKMPSALDESLAGISPKTYRQMPGVAAFILKPAVLGGIEKTMRFARIAKSLGIKPVISSVFESGVGLTALANIAAAINAPDTPVGLGTYTWFKEDVLQTPFCAEEGQINVLAINKTCNYLKINKLERIL